MTDEEKSRMVQEVWDDWLDYGCRCGFPHPKPGRHGPPPTTIERDGILYYLPTYPGVMGSDEPYR